MSRRVVPLLLLLAGCDGAAGADGAPGGTGVSCWDLNANAVADPNEDVNSDGVWDGRDCAGTPGDQGDAGVPGVACWDLDADGATDAAEDVNGDSVWDALDCAGGPGDAGVPGTPCWDLDGDGATDPAEDVNGDGVWDALDCAAVASGTIAGLVVDGATGALVEGATVVAEPFGWSGVTPASGSFQCVDAPFGVYTIVASAPSLRLVADAVVPSADVETVVTGVSLLAGQSVEIHLSLPRLDLETVNVTAVHTAATPVYTVANCHACHSDRTAEVSKDPLLAPWHALPMHASLPCTNCHDGGADVGNESGWAFESGVNLRKQVNVPAKCLGCHSCYPGSFCTGGNCPNPCP